MCLFLFFAHVRIDPTRLEPIRHTNLRRLPAPSVPRPLPSSESLLQRINDSKKIYCHVSLEDKKKRRMRLENCARCARNPPAKKNKNYFILPSELFLFFLLSFLVLSRPFLSSQVSKSRPQQPGGPDYYREKRYIWGSTLEHEKTLLALEAKYNEQVTTKKQQQQQKQHLVSIPHRRSPHTQNRNEAEEEKEKCSKFFQDFSRPPPGN